MSEDTFYTDRSLLARALAFLNPMCDPNPIFEWKGLVVMPTEAHALRDAIRAHLVGKPVQSEKPPEDTPNRPPQKYDPRQQDPRQAERDAMARLGDSLERDAERAKVTEEPILQFFAYDGSSPLSGLIAMYFAKVADQIVERLPRNPERTVALRKLLEAKDAAVRAVLFKP